MIPFQSDTDQEPQKKKRKTDTSVVEDFFSDEEEEDVRTVTSEPTLVTLRDRVKFEVQNYKLKPTVPKKDDPLHFWRNATDLPILQRAARMTLIGQASSVPSERVFSVAGDVVTASRSCLDPDAVDALIFLKKNVDLEHA